MCCYVVYMFFFFFKQKTAYEMRISDWSSDVCFSDLQGRGVAAEREGIDRLRRGHGAEGIGRLGRRRERVAVRHDRSGRHAGFAHVERPGGLEEIGRASCRERVCQYV